MKIGNFIIIRESALLQYQKAHKLARMLTENDLDLILAGKMHLHRNPRRSTTDVALMPRTVPRLAPVEIVTSDGLDPKDAYDFGRETGL